MIFWGVSRNYSEVIGPLWNLSCQECTTGSIILRFSFFLSFYSLFFSPLGVTLVSVSIYNIQAMPTSSVPGSTITE